MKTERLETKGKSQDHQIDIVLIKTHNLGIRTAVDCRGKQLHLIAFGYNRNIGGAANNTSSKLLQRRVVTTNVTRENTKLGTLGFQTLIHLSVTQKERVPRTSSRKNKHLPRIGWYHDRHRLQICQTRRLANQCSCAHPLFWRAS